MNPNELPAELFDLISGKDFSDLTEAEKERVSRWMGEEEYLDYRALLRDFQEANKELDTRFDPPVLPDRQKPFLTRIFTYPIPAYQVAAGFLLIMGAFFLFESRADQAPGSGNTVHTVQQGTSLENDEYPEELVIQF